jgi:hypothetical protein
LPASADTACWHSLREEELPVADRFGVWARFDDEERSATYAERAVPGVRRVAGR